MKWVKYLGIRHQRKRVYDIYDGITYTSKYGMCSVQSNVVVQQLHRFSPRHFRFIPVVFTNLALPVRYVTDCNILQSHLT
jgi:hypothetical protein